MSAARVLSLAVIVFFMAVIGLLWTALNKVSTIQQTTKVAVEAATKRVCKRLPISDDLDLLGYSGCQIEMDLAGVKLRPDERLLLDWELQTLKGSLPVSGSAYLSINKMEIARGGEKQPAPGKVDLTVAYRRTRKADAEASSADFVSGHQRIRIEGRSASASEFSTEVRGGSVEVIPFRSDEFPLNEPFTILEFVFGPTGKDGQRIVEQQTNLRWVGKVSIVAQP